jgi:catechol 2,3-dioxygenase-like lactoylglutathione lyase family enzyme
MASQFTHVNIVCSDLQTMADFLVKQFGGVAGQQQLLDAPWVATLTGLPSASTLYIPVTFAGTNTRFELLQYVQPVGVKDSGVGMPDQLGYRHVGFGVADINAAVAQIQAQGYKFLSPVQTVKSMGVMTVYFHGPDGVLMQLTQAISLGASDA